MNQFTDFEFVNHFKIIIDITVNFKFFHFISQILLSSDLQNSD